MPVAPAFGGKLNSAIASLRSLRADLRSWICLSTRRASMLARSGWTCMSRTWPSSAWIDRPPNTIEPVAPSSSGSATIIVASTGSRPFSDCFQDSMVWNSTACAAM